MPDVTPQELGRQYEKELAKRLGLKQTSASGAKWYDQGDLKSQKVLIEVKHTLKPSFPLSEKLFGKLKKQKKIGQIPIVVVKTESEEFLVMEAHWLPEILKMIEST
jgi:hypothetical protein